VKLLARLTDVLGGPQRRRVIILLGGVLALSFADTATVGAVATQLERDLRGATCTTPSSSCSSPSWPAA